MRPSNLRKMLLFTLLSNEDMAHYLMGGISSWKIAFGYQKTLNDYSTPGEISESVSSVTKRIWPVLKTNIIILLKGKRLVGARDRKKNRK